MIDAIRKTKVKVKRDAGELAWQLGAQLSGWITGADFSVAHFTIADLTDVWFADCNFEGAFFNGTKVTKATFALCRLTPRQRAGLILVK